MLKPGRYALRDRVADMERAVDGPDRYLDVCMALVRDKTGETLLYAGGRFDDVDKRFVDAEPERVAVVRLEESQVEFTLWFAEFLRDYREGYPRDVSLALAAGARRGGKTFDVYMCQLCALVDVPRGPSGTPTVGWTISRTFRARDELDQLVLNYVPQSFYHHRRAPEHRFEFAHGSYLRNLSADDPNSLKQGRVDFLLYNEPQTMSATAVRNGLYGVADNGGLCVLAANPPSGPEGDWLRDLKDAIDEDPEVKRITRYFHFDPAGNSKIDQPARTRVAKIATKIDPDANEADSEGTWKRWGDLAYPAFDRRTLDRGGLVGPPPAVGLRDVTAQRCRAEFGLPYAHVIGGDFQRRPQAAAVMKLFDGPDGVVYWFTDECGVRGTEVELSTELMGYPHAYSPTAPPNGSGDDRSALWVGDCSGSWQGAQRIPGRTSFSLLEGEGWRVFPAEVVRVEGKSEHPKNPDVAQRLGLMLRLMQARRVRVDPRCVWLVEAFAKCELRKTDTGRRVPKGKFAHVTDAASYAVWRMEPKPARPLHLTAADLRSIARRRGGGFYGA